MLVSNAEYPARNKSKGIIEKVRRYCCSTEFHLFPALGPPVSSAQFRVDILTKLLATIPAIKAKWRGDSPLPTNNTQNGSFESEKSFFLSIHGPQSAS
mmetsp:Transcript_12577/g.30030  ORF Transcript_12577/g.30030 Transcript_12577/m.30030 type:complete len:98 (+) Transcript_12577:169-462(+)